MPTLRVSVVQAGSSLFDTLRTLERMAAHVEALARDGADLAVFPEAYVGGYPKGLDFGARVGSRTAAGRDDFLRYWNGAITVPGPETQRIGEMMAARLGAHLVVGVIERGGATLYCTALFFGPDGALLGKHRKLQPTGSERLVWGQGDGSTLTVLDSPIGRIGSAICWENYMPMLRQAMYAKGVQLWCAPTVDDREIWQASMRHIAYEGRTFVLSACQHMLRGDAPDASMPGDVPETVLIDGGRMIVSPFGEVLAGPLRGWRGPAHRQYRPRRHRARHVGVGPGDLASEVAGGFVDRAGHLAGRRVWAAGALERAAVAVGLARPVTQGVVRRRGGPGRPEGAAMLIQLSAVGAAAEIAA